MIAGLLALKIASTAFLIPLDVAAAVLFVYLLVRMPPRRRLLQSLAALVLGAVVGYVTCWLLADVWDVFGVPLTLVTRIWAILAFVGVFVAVANLWGSRWWRKVIAVLAVPIFLLTSAAAINVDFGAYSTVKEAMGLTAYRALAHHEVAGKSGVMDPHLGADWRAPAGMPDAGTVGAVTIPATISGFKARTADVYFPPAALVAHPPVLPVLVLFAGQPGHPSDMLLAGKATADLNAFAAAHHGLAPIVVAPDQLGSPDRNPMCVDSPLGNSETYLTVDVPKWIKSHLKVSSSARYWAVGGFSQGGTCATQFGFGHPNLFGSVIDISGEIAPTIGAATVAKGFGGSAAAYDAAKPLTLLARHAPYADSWAFFGVGALDAKYTRYALALQNGANAAGVTTTLTRSPNTGHDWNTVRYLLKLAIPAVSTRLGLG
jgi:S-formylglutathione hydrolase FrmB